MVLIRLLHVDDGGNGGGPTLGVGILGRRGRRGGLADGPVDGNGASEAVDPLLLVEDVIDLQCVGLRLTGVLRAHAENVLGCGGK